MGTDHILTMATVAHEPVKQAMHRIRALSADVEARRLAFVRERALHARSQARHGLGPRGVPTPLARTQRGLWPAGGTTPSAPSDSIGALPLNVRGSTPYLYTSPAALAGASARL